MKNMLLLSCFCILFARTAAFAGPFSFNEADAKTIITSCKEEGIDIPEELADNIVKYREKNGNYKSSDDLKNVPGMTPQIFMSMELTEDENDLLFEPGSSTSMRAY